MRTSPKRYKTSKLTHFSSVTSSHTSSWTTSITWVFKICHYHPLPSLLIKSYSFNRWPTSFNKRFNKWPTSFNKDLTNGQPPCKSALGPKCKLMFSQPHTLSWSPGRTWGRNGGSEHWTSWARRWKWRWRCGIWQGGKLSKEVEVEVWQGELTLLTCRTSCF